METINAQESESLDALFALVLEEEDIERVNLELESFTSFALGVF